jgi:hypothetical protein
MRPAKRRHASVWAVGEWLRKLYSFRMPSVLFFREGEDDPSVDLLKEK